MTFPHINILCLVEWQFPSFRDMKWENDCDEMERTYKEVIMACTDV